MKISRRSILAGAFASSAAMVPASSWAQQTATDWPKKPVRIIVPNAPGGALDILARLLEVELGKMWKQAVIVEYKPGGSTLIGTDFVAKAAPDGYTMGILAIPVLGIQPALRKMPFDTLRDLSGTMLVVGQVVLCASPKLPVQNLQELVAYGRANKGELSYALSSPGSIMHLAGEKFNTVTGVEMLAIPFKGAGGAFADVFENRINLLIDPTFSALPHIKSGRLKAIAVMGAKRDAALPEVPAVGEMFPDFDFDSHLGVGIPRGTPADITQKINADLVKAIRSEALAERLKEMGLSVTGSTTAEFDTYMRKSMATFADIVKTSKISIQ